MTSVSNDAQLQQYMNMFAQSVSTLGGNYSQYVNTGMSGINSLWTIGQGVEAGNADQITAGTMQLSNLAMSIFSMIADPKQKAADDVKKTDTKITDGNNGLKEIKKASNEKIQAIIDQMKAEADKVDLSIKELEKIVGTNGTLTSAQNALEEKKAEIEEQKAILNNPGTSIEDKKEALLTLTGISAQIKGLAEQVAALMVVVEGETTKVEASTAQLEALSAQGEEVVAQSLEQAGATVSRTSTGVITDVSQQTAEGTAEESIGGSMVAAGAAAEASVVGAGAGAEMQEKGAELISAGTEHLTGSAANMTKFGQAIGEWGGDFTSIGYDMQLLGSANSAALLLVGSYNLQLESTIAAIGSWANVTATAAELDEAITTYSQAIGMDEVTETEDGNCNQSAESENNVVTNGIFTNNTSIVSTASQNSEGDKKVTKTTSNGAKTFNGINFEDVKFEFDSSKFKITKFGI